MAKNVAIEQLPDYPAIKQIQGALWGIGETRGAAVFVGAGFSRNAVLPAPNSPKPPLWSDFSRIMGERLYQGSKDATSDPLRLAQEYKATLGSTALDSLIYDLVRDEEWLPGQLHSRLVSLPWTDILTTNWDTLLERAARVTDREETYDAVTTIGDIPRTRSPRIVKVHGSMPSNRPFIFTEEDYRTYPRDFAPFVNLVQQVLLENELCLIGFSGDDPNFLQWSGWIRDQLGDSARRIYLVGVLNLAPSHRKYLEARKVIPIDLAPTVDEADAEERHSMASGLFLDFLHNSRPKPAWQWLSKAGSIRSQQLLGMSINQSESTARIRIRVLLEPSQRLFFEPEIDLPQFGSAGGPHRIVNAFERDCLTVFNQRLAPHRYQRFFEVRGHRFPFPGELPNTPSIRVMIRSAHCTADAIKHSVRGLGRLSPRSSGVFRCRATRIPATMASTRLRPSSIRNSP